jgi:hypothetical protein
LNTDGFNIITLLGFLYHVEMGLVPVASKKHEDSMTFRNVGNMALFQTAKKIPKQDGY